MKGLDEIQVFRTLADAHTIKERLADCGQALILGGDILGLELAGGLFKMGQQPDIDAPKIGVVQRSALVGKSFIDAPAAESILRLPFLNASIIYTLFYSLIGVPHNEGGTVYLWQEGDGYRKFRVVDGRLAGALLPGQRHGTMAIFYAIGQEVSRFGADIARPDLPWNDLGGQDWDYMFYRRKR